METENLDFTVSVIVKKTETGVATNIDVENRNSGLVPAPLIMIALLDGVSIVNRGLGFNKADLIEALLKATQRKVL